MKPYSYLIVEDEPLAQKVIQKHLENFPGFQLAGICENAVQAFETISKKKIDLLFLDITLPSISGIDFIRSLKNAPAVIFTTAYSEYAVSSYELDAVDYLLKPITLERLGLAMDKFLKLQKSKLPPADEDFFFFKEGGKLVKVYFQDIQFVEARKDYLLLHLSQRPVITHRTMKTMEQILPAGDFIRIHRSYIVSKKAVTRVATAFLEVSGKRLPIGEKYKARVLTCFKAN